MQENYKILVVDDDMRLVRCWNVISPNKASRFEASLMQNRWIAC